MNKLATVTQLVNCRARKILLQNYVNTILLYHIQWAICFWVKLVVVTVLSLCQGYVTPDNRKLLLIFLGYIHTLKHTKCHLLEKYCLNFLCCCQYSPSAHQNSSKERILTKKYAPFLEPDTVEGGDASSSWDQWFFLPEVMACCFLLGLCDAQIIHR